MKAPTLNRQAEDEEAQSETIRETFANPKSGPVEELSDTIEAPPDSAPLLVESGEGVVSFIDGLWFAPEDLLKE